MDDKRDFDWARAAWDRAEGRYAKQISAALESGRSALQAALLLNAGASLALLWLLANTFSAETVPLQKLTYIDRILASVRYFAVGAFLAGCASGFAYFANHLYAESMFRAKYTLTYPYIEDTAASSRLRRSGFLLLLLTTLLVATSLILFLSGLNSILRLF
ncbi:MAG: hypothetical protein M3145_04000 [Pseudomonadota bacterium]|nr:hypothetical protein [Pseudomonadota bacterium]